MKSFLACCALLISVVVVPGCKSAATTAATPITPAITTPDTLDYSFVVLGCNRLDKADTNTATNPSTANVEQFNRSMTDIAALNPKPDYLFFAGDMVLGYADDSTLLAKELNGWRTLYESTPAKAAGITLVVMPGNHESENSNKFANAMAERQWIRIMAPYIVGNNGPGPGTADSLLTDQSRLTYSFDFKSAHFVILNTDPTGRDSRVPSNWIASDLAAASAAGQKQIFAIGHKPAYPYNYLAGGTGGLNMYAWNRDQFWNAMESNNAVAMISAHNHVYARLRPNKTWMIVAGNAGSSLESNLPPSEQFYGFTLVQVMKNGRIIEKTFGRNLPAAGYNAPCPASTYPTTVRDSANINW